MTQEGAAWVIHGLLCRSPPPSQQFCHEILKNNPEMIDLLFKCAAFVRPPWYPESQVDSIASESIAMLFRISPHTIPGVVVKVEDSIQTMADDEWNTLVESLKILTSRPNWVDMLLNVWKTIDNEKWQDVQRYVYVIFVSSWIVHIRRMLKQVTSRYHAQTDIDDESLLAVFEYRGSSPLYFLISSMRKIKTKNYSIMSYLNGKACCHAHACC
jgi:hypothetical protein